MEPHEPTPAKLKLWRCICSAMVATMLSGWCFAQDAVVERPKPPFVPKITISKETTWATEPVGPNGFVDYVAVVNQVGGRGVTPENNVVVVLSRALGPAPENGRGLPDLYYELLGMEPLPKEGPYFTYLWQWWDRKGKKLPPGGEKEFWSWEEQANARPWKSSEFPDLAEWLADMEAPLRVAIEASERTEFFSPLHHSAGTPLCQMTLSVQSKTRTVCRALVTRAMLRLGEEDRFAAWNDLLAAHRLSRLLGRGPFAMDALIGYGTERDVIAAELRLVLETQPSSKFTSRYLKQLSRLPPLSPIIDKIDASERIGYLDDCQQIARNRIKTDDFGRKIDVAWHEKLVEDAVMRQIDWDEILRIGNRRFDQLKSAFRQPTYRQREAALRPWDDEIKILIQRREKAPELFTTLKGQPALTALTSDMLTVVWLSRIRQTHLSETTCRQRLRNLEVALALSAWRGEHDSYPKSLGDLVPKYLAVVPQDLFTDQPLRYERMADGYRLYSFGINGKDDDGRDTEDKPEGDDLAVQMSLPKPKVNQ